MRLLTLTVIATPLTTQDATAPGSATATACSQLVIASAPRWSCPLEVTPDGNWLVSTESAPDWAPRYAAVSARVDSLLSTRRSATATSSAPSTMVTTSAVSTIT